MFNLIINFAALSGDIFITTAVRNNAACVGFSTAFSGAPASAVFFAFFPFCFPFFAFCFAVFFAFCFAVFFAFFSAGKSKFSVSNLGELFKISRARFIVAAAFSASAFSAATAFSAAFFAAAVAAFSADVADVAAAFSADVADVAAFFAAVFCFFFGGPLPPCIPSIPSIFTFAPISEDITES